MFVENFLHDIMKFSTQKYSSNIIEKCMDCCDENTKELISQKYCESYIIEKLLFDMYGNYVLQKIISLSKEPLTSKYLAIIGPLMKQLSSYSFGQKLYNKLLSSFPNLSNYLGIKGEGGKMKKFKGKKNNIKMNNTDNNMNGLNLINNNNYHYNSNMQMMNLQNNINFNNNNSVFIPGMNNFYIPFQLNNNVNSPNSNNNFYLNNIMNNNNNYGINFSNSSNMNNFIQSFNNSKANNKMNKGSQLMVNFNNQ
jgi:hypothetical protein